MDGLTQTVPGNWTPRKETAICVGRRWPPAAGGALVILALTSAQALGECAVVDRLTMPDEEARVLSAAAAHDSTIASAEDQAGRLNKELPATARVSMSRSGEHTSELQSRPHLVCRLLLEKK